MITECFLGKPPQNVEDYILTKHPNPLCFTAVDAGAVVQLKCVGTNLKTQVFQTSTDKINWTDHSFNSRGMLVNSRTSTEFILPNVGDKIYFKAKTDNTGIPRNASNHLQFTTTQDTKLIDVSGNVMSLLSPEFQNLKQVSLAQFFGLFYKNKSIRECDKLILPATTLANGCYCWMFQDCSSLTQAPKLPATTLADRCYIQMFCGCTSLTQAPKLPATRLVSECYSNMFLDCENLSSIEVNHTKWSPANATLTWVKGVSSTGTFKCPAALPQISGNNYIPNGWSIETK